MYQYLFVPKNTVQALKVKQFERGIFSILSQDRKTDNYIYHSYSLVVCYPVLQLS